VKDLAASTRSYEAIGCRKNEQFSDENAASMVWSETISFQLLTHRQYSTFTSKPITDSHRASAMLIALSQTSREAVDEIVQAASAAGGKADIREPQDMGFMYLRTFEYSDGNTYEPMWMDTKGPQ
jgi:predicted lactoylglutathione lyase